MSTVTALASAFAEKRETDIKILEDGIDVIADFENECSTLGLQRAKEFIVTSTNSQGSVSLEFSGSRDNATECEAVYFVRGDKDAGTHASVLNSVQSFDASRRLGSSEVAFATATAYSEAYFVLPSANEGEVVVLSQRLSITGIDATTLSSQASISKLEVSLSSLLEISVDMLKITRITAGTNERQRRGRRSTSADAVVHIDYEVTTQNPTDSREISGE